MKIKYDLFFGSLLGEAIGDALGAPIEGFKRERLNKYFHTLKLPYTYLDIQNICYDSKGFYRDLPGLHTDDTQYMLVLLDSIKKDEKGNFHYVLSTSLQLFRGLMSAPIPASKSGALRGTGKNARTSFLRLIKNQNLSEIGTDSAGIGSAMRIGPPSLLFKDDKNKLIEFVIKSSIITHLNCAGITAGFAQALLTIECHEFHKKLTQKKSSLKQDVMESAFRIVKEIRNFEDNLIKNAQKAIPGIQIDINDSPEYEHVISEALEHVSGLIKANINSSQAIERILKKHGARAPSGFAPVGMSVTFYQVLKMIDSPIECLCNTLALGGDTDTIGAMVGSAIFAAHGAEKIPEPWKKDLLAKDELKKRADFLINNEDASPTDLIQLETDWSKKIKTT
jgi:ADP-ribosylglycohydrolase